MRNIQGRNYTQRLSYVLSNCKKSFKKVPKKKQLQQSERKEQAFSCGGTVESMGGIHSL